MGSLPGVDISPYGKKGVISPPEGTHLARIQIKTIEIHEGFMPSMMGDPLIYWINSQTCTKNKLQNHSRIFSELRS